MNGAPAPQPPVHVCFSGDLSCSGVNPCAPCWHTFATRVLPSALAASGLNGGLLEVVQVLANALATRGVDAAALGIHPQLLTSSSEEQFSWFHAGLERGRQALAQQMQTPAGQGDRMGLLGQYKSTPVTNALPEPVPAYAGYGAPGQGLQPAPPGIVNVPAGADLSQPGVLETLIKQAPPAAAPMRTLTAEDIAAAGSIATPST